MTASLYLPPSLLHFIPRHLAWSTWAHHLPFGYDLIAALRPSVLVELGTYSGLSFFCFCQSMDDHDVDGVCYAVDTWQGDKHTGTYEEQIYQQVAKHSRDFYPGFSYLMRMPFAEARGHFTDESIDLLHIDGLHTYQAVTEDFENWYPRLRPGGVILLHDIYARMMDFGVWRFWEERSADFESFEFKHGFGLGVLRKPGGPVRNEQLLQLLFSADRQEHAKLRAYYVQIARHVALRRRFMRHCKNETLLPPGRDSRVGQNVGDAVGGEGEGKAA